ncbi:GTPase HflX [Ketogulonicigenium vulgare]|uniref:GTPase HflX n=1 Tax=Ketogulonicigenium vulgare (strain WSH-001) TaxID=759362 RepID=F9Y5I6_KETVW|nr:GTPase HflX [Ketogulonicigenium vulgare]ADO42543.1 GTP-binding protein HflX [Ketogulonicigenium vulgare Y25]AEM40739.1 GTP binding protein-like protein [Ketogulonicigenium vulgare WSH-001]ALJ80908.1 GTPase HflX [Ketogulonicigenium vulgare]ANW33679.1 GTPase HflX [Ketogulonicigenium vulgare]AOZ54456.1 GTP-binding protein HflX [Ketogulonicigenium vulgare]
MLNHQQVDTPAWIVHPEIKSDVSRREADAALDEAKALADALPGLDVLGAEIVRLPKVHAGMLFGSGKVQELKERITAHGVKLVLIDGALSPVQQRNLEREWGVKILDRMSLILEIFSDRARTREGVLQVEIAALSYQRTRLVRAWTHLERQRGGFGFVGGPGETQRENDRRAIDEQLLRLERQLEKVQKTRALHRAARAKVPYPIVALVGYTNAGKSSLFNRVTGADVLAKDQLFATLDPTMRRLTLPDGQEVIMSDTVGFISDLPTQLVAAFRATLEEVLEADLILHVRDISHPQTAQQARDVMQILHQIGVPEDAPMLEVLNKIDLLDEAGREAFQTEAARKDAKIAVSALTGEGVEALLEQISAALAPPFLIEDLRLPHTAGKLRAWLYAEGVVEGEVRDDFGMTLSLKWTQVQSARFNKMRDGMGKAE